MSYCEQPVLTNALDQLWSRFFPQIEERVANLVLAADRLATGDLTDEERFEAGSAAHKLAGSLGTFGLQEGTLLAREAEQLYGSTALDSPLAARLAEIAAELKRIIANR